MSNKTRVMKIEQKLSMFNVYTNSPYIAPPKVMKPLA